MKNDFLFKKHSNVLSLLILMVSLFTACQGDQIIQLEQGMIIKESLVLEKDTFFLEGVEGDSKPAIIIEGENIIVDFNESVIIGSKQYSRPDLFKGLGIEIRNGKNITIKNLILKGYKIGLRATGIESLKIENADLSYNYRQGLKSTREKENEEDWMSYHQNDQDEWLRYGMAVYLKECNHAVVKNLKITGGQNGLMMSACNDGLFYNNDIRFNSGVGIGMYRSSKNKVMHNQLDWNIRGFSFGVYNRGQDSAGILLYEQCNENTIAFNSATHSGDGFFLWAGDSTIDSGKGGCNKNLVYKNDFSYASNNGIEVTFSGYNRFLENKLWGCDYGLWGGYSYGMEIIKNDFKNNNRSIAIEHGNNNQIAYNDFLNDKIGILLFERSEQPKSWPFAQKRNIKSRNYTIAHNDFKEMETPLKVSDADSVLIINNIFSGIEKVNVDEGLGMILKDNALVDVDEGRSVESNDRKVKVWRKTEEALFNLPKSLDDGMDTFAPKVLGPYTGRKHIIMDEFGPYNFQYPFLILRSIDEKIYTFAIFGPFGNWKAKGGTGFKMMSQKQGAIPATLVLEAEENASQLSVDLEYIGPAFRDPFGQFYKKGKPYKVTWQGNAN